MVLGLSDDIIGEKASKGLRRISRYYLYVSFLILGFLAIVFYYSIYRARNHWFDFSNLFPGCERQENAKTEIKFAQQQRRTSRLE